MIDIENKKEILRWLIDIFYLNLKILSNYNHDFHRIRLLPENTIDHFHQKDSLEV